MVSHTTKKGKRMELRAVPRDMMTEKPGICRECGSANLVTDDESGETVCANCGLVVDDVIVSERQEWRAFTHDEESRRSRVGAPTSLSVHDKGLATVIDKVSRDGLGRKLSPDVRLKMLKLRKWHNRSLVYSSQDRNLSQAMSQLELLSDKLHIPPAVKEQAALIYRKALAKDLTRGRVIAEIAVACLYAACRLTETPRSLKEFVEKSRLSRKDLSRSYRLVIKELDIRMPIPLAEGKIPVIAAEVGVGAKTQKDAMDILMKARKLKATTGKDPVGLAAAALYIASVQNNEKRTQTTIAQAAGVTEVTIRNRLQGLRDALHLEF